MTKYPPGEPILEKKERGDLDDPKKVGRKALLERLEAKQEIDDTAFILSTEQGRRFYWRILEKCGLLRSSFSTEVNRTYFYEGSRNIGLILYKLMMDSDPMAFIKMQQEDKKREAQKE